MPIPTAITDLSDDPTLNPPAGSENPIEGDNHLRQIYAFLRQIYDGTSGIAYATAADLADTTDPSKGAGMVGYSQVNAYPGGTTGGRLKQDITVMDLKYMTLAQIVDVVSYTGALDVTACIQAALNDMANTTWTGAASGAYTKGGGKVYLPPGKWRTTDTLKIGSNTELFGASAWGHTAPGITTNTGTIIRCDFSAGSQKRWAISSATFETATGNFAAFNTRYSGAQHDSGVITLTMGIKVHDLLIDANGAYGGVRLLASSGFDVQNVMVYGVGVGFEFNTSYGARYGNLRSIFSLYGCVISQCTAIEGGHLYADKSGSTWSNVAADPTTRLVSTFDMSASAFLPADWSNKTYGLYVENSIAMSFHGPQTCEHADIGCALAHVSDFVLNGYFEGNGDSNTTFVAATGQMTVFSNGTTSGTKYHFGTLNNITMDGCSVGGIYVGETVSNVIRVRGADGIGTGTTDWTWSDAVLFEDIAGVLKVSATGSATAVIGYTTLDEALRRIQASRKDRKDWVVRIKDGDTVATTAQRNLSDRRISFEQEGSGSRPTISVGAAGGGFVFRCPIAGDMVVTFSGVNISFPTGVAGVAGDRGLFLIPANTCTTMRLDYQHGTIHLGNAYALLQVSAGGSINLNAAFADAGITSTVAGPVMASSGSATVMNSGGAAGVTVDAGIKAIGTNGWQATVYGVNFA